MSRIDWKRSAGSFSSAFSTTIRSGSGTSSGSGPAGWWTIACSTSKSDAPANGRRPASTSYSTTPKEKMSLRASTASPRVCSGDMYATVPTTTPVRVVSSVGTRVTSGADPS
jgi:hypothetical protein